MGSLRVLLGFSWALLEVSWDFLGLFFGFLGFSLILRDPVATPQSSGQVKRAKDEVTSIVRKLKEEIKGRLDVSSKMQPLQLKTLATFSDLVSQQS